MEDQEFIQFIPLKKLLMEDNEEVKKIKTIYKREEEYANILGPIEIAIAGFYLENRKLKDKSIVKAIKNIKSNYYKELEYFEKPIEKVIMIASSAALQKRKKTRHEFLLVLSYILWSIDNRRWLGYPRAYLDWLLSFFGMIEQREKRELEKRFGELEKNLEITIEDEEWSRKDSEYFAMSDDEKYEYLLKCEEEPDCEFANFGKELEEKGEFEKAERLYERDKNMYPEHYGGDFNLGMLYKRMKRFKLAEIHLKNALKLALKQKGEDPECIDDEVIDMIRGELEEAKKLSLKS